MENKKVNTGATLLGNAFGNRISALFSHKEFLLYFKNTSWLIGEKICRMAIGLFIGILVARHLGPKDFGILNYACSIIDFLDIFVYLGLSGLVVRELVCRKDETNLILGTTFFIKLIGSILGFLAVASVAFLTSNSKDPEFWVLIIIGLGLLPRPLFQTIDFWFQSQVKSKYTAIALMTAFSITAVVKIILVLCGALVIPIAIAWAADFLAAAILLLLLYHGKAVSVFQWKPRLGEAMNLLRRSWILVLGTFLGLVNLKTDQVMLRWMVGPEEVGIYSVAVRFSEIWYFIPIAMMMSLFPKLITLKDEDDLRYNLRQQQILDLFFLISFSLAIATSLLAHILIPMLFGQEYTRSAGILVIHIWAGIFMFMRALFSKWVLIEDSLIFGLISHGSGAIVNIVLNIILIPIAQGKGAAIATLASYAMSSYLFLFMSARTRPLASKMSKSLVLPLRLALYGRKIWS